MLKDAVGYATFQQTATCGLLTVLVEDLGTSLEPDWLLEGDAVLCQQLGEDASQSSKHGPPGVDDLDLPAAWQFIIKQLALRRCIAKQIGLETSRH